MYASVSAIFIAEFALAFLASCSNLSTSELSLNGIIIFHGRTQVILLTV